MPVTLGYWNIRGLAAPIRLMLAYREVDFVNELYQVGPGPEFNKEGWYSKKFTLGLGPLANLPYFIDGDLKMTESLAIMNYIARKYNLNGKTEEDHVRADMLLLHMKDANKDFTIMAYGNYEAGKGPFLSEYLPKELQKLTEILGDKNFFIGDEITKADFFAFEFLCKMEIFQETSLEKFDKLVAFKKRIESLEPIAKYLESDRFIKLPVNNPNAQWSQP